MTRFLFVLWLIVLPGLNGESRILPPAFGFVKAEGGRLLLIVGVRGNLVARDTLAEGIVSSAFWTGGGVAKTEGLLLVYDADGNLLEALPAPPGRAVAGFDRRGRPALVYFQDAGATWVRRGPDLGASYAAELPRSPAEADAEELRGNHRCSTQDRTNWSSFATVIEGVVVSASAGDGPELIVRRGEGLWRVQLSEATGRPLGEFPLPGLAPPFLILPDGGSVSIEGRHAIVRDSRGSESHADLPFPVDRLELAGPNTVFLGGFRQGALFRVNTAGSGVAILPGGSQ